MEKMDPSGKKPETAAIRPGRIAEEQLEAFCKAQGMTKEEALQKGFRMLFDQSKK